MLIRLVCVLAILLPTVAEAAAAYVSGCGNASGASSTTITCALGAASTGDTIAGAVTFGNNTATITGCSDGTNTYVLPAATLVRDGTNLKSIQGFYAQNITGGTYTVTCTISTTLTGRGIVAHIITGAATSAFDQAIGQNQQNPGTGTDAVTSTAVTTTADGEYIFSASADTRPSCGVESPGTSFTVRDYSTCAGTPIRSESRIQTSAGSIAGTWTAGDAADDFSTIVMTFKELVSSSILMQGGMSGNFQGVLY